MNSSSKKSEDELMSARTLAVTGRGGRFDPFTEELLDEGGGTVVSGPLSRTCIDGSGNQAETEEEQ